MTTRCWRHPFTEMQLWSETTGRLTKLEYRCPKCGRTRPRYPAPMRWLFVTVSRHDMEDCVFPLKPWLGAVGDWPTRWRTGDVTFTVVPLNVLLDLFFKALNWARYRKPGDLAAAREDAYRIGTVDGAARQRALWRKELGQRTPEAVMQLLEDAIANRRGF